jgi:membrane protein implicated in regulation of membrane protease activity
MELYMELLWLGLLVLFLVVEAISVGLTSIWFAAGALVALAAALLGGGPGWQVGLFVAVSLVCLLAVRPLARRYLNSRVQPTNADRILGSEAEVTEAIDNVLGRGAVTIGGVSWTARSNGDPIPAGARVRVLRIEGVKVFVEPVKEEVKC